MTPKHQIHSDANLEYVYLSLFILQFKVSFIMPESFPCGIVA